MAQKGWALPRNRFAVAPKGRAVAYDRLAQPQNRWANSENRWGRAHLAGPYDPAPLRLRGVRVEIPTPSAGHGRQPPRGGADQ
jgi:hypothetical protein